MRVSVNTNVALGLRKSLRESDEREIGGMLFAEQLAAGDFNIVDFSVDLNAGSPTFFTRDPAAHQDALEAFFEKTGRDFSRFNYLGEWHSHPNFSVRPSPEDVRTMTNLVKDVQTGISFAVLLIVRLRFHFWLDYSTTCFANGYEPQAIKLARRVKWI